VTGRILNLPAIDAALRRLQSEFPHVAGGLRPPRDPLSDDVVQNLLAGYAYVDWLAASDIPLFAMGHLKHLLELNRIVLCGAGTAGAGEYARHLMATERRFYEQRDGGIRDLVEWQARRERESVWKRAAGAYVRIVSKPQLFIEGNHRTGALVMSYLLVREGQPPFVLAPESAAAYFDAATAAQDVHKQSLTMVVRLPGLRGRLARVLAEDADPRFLRPGRRRVARPAAARDDTKA
jgi:hypothetical protein